MRYVIVGNGVAGTKAAETIRRRDPVGEIIVLSKEEVPFYRRPSLVEHLVGKVPLDHLWGRPEDFYRQANIDLRLGTPAVALNAHARELTLGNGEVLAYDRLLLAMGLGRPAGGPPGSDLQGIVTLLTLDDLPALRSEAKLVRQSVVVGEGILGLALAQALRLLGLEVTYLLAGSRFWPEVLSPDASVLVEQRLQSEGVQVRPAMRVQEFLGQGGRVHAVRTASGEKIPCQVVGMAEGLRPELGWAHQAGLKAGQRISVNDDLSTNLRDVYAAGDAVQLAGEVLSFGWLRAWHQGTLAAVNMTGGSAPYRRRTASLSTRAFGMPILVMGDPNPKDARRYHGEYPMNGVHKELVVDGEGRVVGAVMVGEVSEASAVEPLVRQQVVYAAVSKELLRRLFDLRYWAAAGAEVLCPVCKFLMHMGEAEIKEGRVTCPICGAEFDLRRTGDRFVVILE